MSYFYLSAFVVSVLGHAATGHTIYRGVPIKITLIIIT
jgi:hypothetical protein